jgi:hypothetical protein
VELIALIDQSLIRTTSTFCGKSATNVNDDFTNPSCYSPFAKRMNMNSRGCQPTDHRSNINPTLKGSHHQSSKRASRIRRTHRQPIAPSFGPFKADVLSSPVPWVSPTAIHVVRLRRTAAPAFPGNYFSGPNHNACNHS